MYCVCIGYGNIYCFFSVIITCIVFVSVTVTYTVFVLIMVTCIVFVSVMITYAVFVLVIIMCIVFVLIVECVLCLY